MPIREHGTPEIDGGLKYVLDHHESHVWEEAIDSGFSYAVIFKSNQLAAPEIYRKWRGSDPEKTVGRIEHSMFLQLPGRDDTSLYSYPVVVFKSDKMAQDFLDHHQESVSLSHGVMHMEVVSKGQQRRETLEKRAAEEDKKRRRQTPRGFGLYS